jgi:hypothetical protein
MKLYYDDGDDHGHIGKCYDTAGDFFSLRSVGWVNSSVRTQTTNV